MLFFNEDRDGFGCPSRSYVPSSFSLTEHKLGSVNIPSLYTPHVISGKANSYLASILIPLPSWPEIHFCSGINDPFSTKPTFLKGTFDFRDGPGFSKGNSTSVGHNWVQNEWTHDSILADKITGEVCSGLEEAHLQRKGGGDRMPTSL